MKYPSIVVPRHVEKLLEDLAESLQIPPSRYEEAERSYKSVGKWLHRDNSRLRDTDPQVYIQGSFRLGTAIKPVSDEEDYDVDLVCELSLSKTHLTQAQLKAALGYELKLYAKAQGMETPEEGRRCWTQNYADGAQFHMDTLPSIPDGVAQRLLLESRGHTTEWSDTAIAITDRDHPRYRQITPNWPHSNPKGYGNWFRSRMAAIFTERRRAMARDIRASVEDIPDYKVRTPLQSAIQILKRHRDMMFEERSDDKPISIILTTLGAHAYEQEPTIAGALYSILQRMDMYIENRSGVDWIENPTDPAENFADRWQQHPERKVAFHEWLDQAREDFANVARTLSLDSAATLLKPKLGTHLVETAAARRSGTSTSKIARLLSGVGAIGRTLNPAHKQPPPWGELQQGDVRIFRATALINGFRPEEFSSNGRALPKKSDLRFFAETTVPKPYKVYWQVVNTGREAEAARCLRGGFDAGAEISKGSLKRNESTLYTGTHAIECFVVKDNCLAARSGQFIVNIQ
jgi:hypothetical protein